MLKTIRKIKWYLDNYDTIRELVKEPTKKKATKRTYSLKGVPSYQRDYINKTYNKE